MGFDLAGRFVATKVDRDQVMSPPSDRARHRPTQNRSMRSTRARRRFHRGRGVGEGESASHSVEVVPALSAARHAGALEGPTSRRSSVTRSAGVRSVSTHGRTRRGAVATSISPLSPRRTSWAGGPEIGRSQGDLRGRETTAGSDTVVALGRRSALPVACRPLAKGPGP